jgi:hypothetical protein
LKSIPVLLALYPGRIRKAKGDGHQKAVDPRKSPSGSVLAPASTAKD